MGAGPLWLGSAVVFGCGAVVGGRDGCLSGAAPLWLGAQFPAPLWGVGVQGAEKGTCRTPGARVGCCGVVGGRARAAEPHIDTAPRPFGMLACRALRRERVALRAQGSAAAASWLGAPVRRSLTSIQPRAPLGCCPARYRDTPVTENASRPGVVRGRDGSAVISVRRPGVLGRGGFPRLRSRRRSGGRCPRGRSRRRPRRCGPRRRSGW